MIAVTTIEGSRVCSVHISENRVIRPRQSPYTHPYPDRRFTGPGM
jgi:hypothetical protein